MSIDRHNGQPRSTASHKKKNPGPFRHRAGQHIHSTIMAMPSPPLPEAREVRNPGQTGAGAIPPIRWIIVGYFFWVGIYLGALIMHSATAY